MAAMGRGSVDTTSILPSLQVKLPFGQECGLRSLKEWRGRLNDGGAPAGRVEQLNEEELSEKIDEWSR